MDFDEGMTLEIPLSTGSDGDESSPYDTQILFAEYVDASRFTLEED